MSQDGFARQSNAGNGKRPYRKPEMVSEQMFETKAMACGKIETGQPASDCEQNGFPPNSTS